MGKKFTLEQYIEKAKKYCGERFDYGIIDYKAIKKLVKYKCIKHSLECEQRAGNHFFFLFPNLAYQDFIQILSTIRYTRLSYE